MAEETTQSLYVTITRVDGPLFDGQAESVTVPGAEGELTILAKHEPFISPLRPGTITVRPQNGEVETFTIESGTIEVSSNQATILV